MIAKIKEILYVDLEMRPEELRNLADKIEQKEKQAEIGDNNRIVDILPFEGGAIRFLSK